MLRSFMVAPLEHGIGERRFAGTRFEIVEHAQLLKISSQVAIVTLIHRDKGLFRSCRAEQARGFSAAVVVVPGLDHLCAINLAPGVENLFQPVLDFLRRNANRLRGGIEPRALSLLCRNNHRKQAAVRTGPVILAVHGTPKRLKRVEEFLTPLLLADYLKHVHSRDACKTLTLELDIVSPFGEARVEGALEREVWRCASWQCSGGAF